MSADKHPSDKPDASSGKRVAGQAKSKTGSTVQAESTTRPKGRFPVVGIGASAGGLEALEELLQNMPAETGMAFVIVTHQHPGHTSLLPELLGRCTPMPVVQAQDGTRLERNHVYVAPPGGHVAVLHATLRLMDGPKGEMPPLPIDFFFRSLAEDQKDSAVCIVLSGTGSDGTLGLKAVKGEAGMAMVQEVRSAGYAGMPSSAIATNQADYVMRPAAMPAQLVAYEQAMARCGPRPPAAAGAPADLDQPMQKVFVLLRARTGHDFSAYKPTTMRRRIERRMTVHGMKDPDQYVRLLQVNPHEIDILFKELLIGVTSFFRDPEAFQNLADKVLPELMRTRPDGYTFRAWVPGCGSGEEAYTLAIVLRECAQRVEKIFDFQVFATDLDAKAIEAARVGHYPAGIAPNVPPALLRRYFTREDDTYRIRKDIREMLVFAPQNVIKDPPFTNVDLLCCRNLLIYLNADLQKRLLPIFHYALKPEGVLLLGPSETIGAFGDLFTTLHKKWKIFKRKETTRAHVLPEIPAQPARDEPGRMTRTAALPPAKPAAISSQIEDLLLSRFAPPTVVVNERGDIIYIHGRTGAYLEPPTGRPSNNIHAMAREGLRTQLAAALRQALVHDQEVVRRNVRVKTNGDYERVDLSIARIAEPETLRGLLLVTFRPTPPIPAETARKKAGRSSTVRPPAGRVQELEGELQHTKESLQTAVEELETANEELRSANEELQSTNEELQSTNEELETSREEMQSLNEELTTVNAELQSKLDDLSRTNDDMQNLLNSTGIATIFLDNDLNIKRYTEQARNVIKLLPNDVGRPVSDLASVLRYDRLAEDAREVLDSLARKELEVQDGAGAWFLLRMVPYRTSENVIEGVVITFVDVTETKEAEAAAGRQARELLQSTFDTLHQPAVVLDHDLRVVTANGAFLRTFAGNPAATEGELIYRVGGGVWDDAQLHQLLEDIIPNKTAIEHFEVKVAFPETGERVFSLRARRLERKTGLPGMILLSLDEVTAGA